MALTKAEIKSMGYRQLRKACKKEGLPTAGNTQALRGRLEELIAAKKRGTAKSQEAEPSPKRQKKSVADDLICPISRELPFDPVHAEDGQVYERDSIEEYFSTKEGDDVVKSPAMGRMMGRQLLPAPHIKNVIETSIENGQITGDLADKWLEKAKEKNEMEELLKEAENGDVEAMVEMGNCYAGYRYGCDTFKEDKKKAFHWYEKACSAGNPTAMAKVGGIGVQAKRQKGAYYVGRALEKGSDLAAYIMGMYLAEGKFGFDVDATEAKRLLAKCLEASIEETDLGDKSRERAQKLLDELLSGSC